MLSALGTNVTMNIRTESILRSFDSMLSENLKEIMTHHDIKIRLAKPQNPLRVTEINLS